MRRTQLYLDDAVYDLLKSRARLEKTTISDLVREALREKYAPNQAKRQAAMLGIIGLRKDWPESLDTSEYIRKLRNDHRSENLRKL